MARLLTMTHPDQKRSDGEPATAPTTLGAFNRVWEKKGWKLTKESETALKEEGGSKSSSSSSSSGSKSS